MNRMQEKYNEEVVPALRKAFDLQNIMQVPRVDKVVVNIGMGEAMDNPKSLEAAVSDLTIIVGQKPVMTKARKSIANFKLREGRLIGTKVTLRWGPHVGIPRPFVEYCPPARPRFSRCFCKFF
jgi:large subunit ribosomal protein L5